ncbi:hypothetical protein F8M41_014320 [Gigaspora margarita]|uniref:Uncharacterized protein n=1 Tax=Gigaspora margarita TaxID=4874 RepID=A0A8H4ARK4_GIGMA|nr:hypothetical protein F8M41_014320 [Gigaspora margarita]
MQPLKMTDKAINAEASTSYAVTAEAFDENTDDKNAVDECTVDENAIDNKTNSCKNKITKANNNGINNSN